MKKIEKDKIWSESVAYRAKMVCEICGSLGCDAHHLFKRRYIKTRWDIDNGIWLCRREHIWAENNPRKFKEWFILVRGRDIYKQLFNKANEI
jgi:hypothetical protein